MPYAQLHYPFENKDHFEKNYPADFIAEGVDQTRGWFFTLHAIASMVFDSVAYKNVVSNGLVLAKDGMKMSKRLGNTVDPFETIGKYGADATRWYMISNASPWDNLKFDLEGIAEVQRKFFGTLYNTYSFFSLYANIDGFAFEQENVPLKERPEIDRWVISLLNTLKKEVENDFANYEPTLATRKIQNFVDQHLSNWYVRLCRRRFWKGEYEQDKVSAYQTLYECMVTISKLMAPVAPFFADWLYQNLNNATQLESSESVHLALFPESDDTAIDEKLEQRMDYAQRISSLVLSLRKKDNLRVRQPLRKILLPILDQSFKDQIEAVKDLILAEVNVKEIEYISDTAGIIKKKAKPNFKTLGRRLGANMKAGLAAINAFDQDTIAQIEKSNAYSLELNGEQYEITLEDIEILSEDIPGWQVASDKDITVALDIQLDESLIAEGTARELVNRIQNIRKSKDFNIIDRIMVVVTADEKVDAALAQFGGYICNEVLANSITSKEGLDTGEVVELFEGEEVRIDVNKS
jgi:isoleucyl-tRNA synthetase